MDLKNAAAVPVFISYSHRDEKYRKALETHLASLQRTGVIEAWHDRKIGPGKEWEHEIESHIESAKIILLLLSPDFLASDYCWSDEGKRALALHEAGQAQVIPVILRPCDWKNTPWGKLQALPKAGRPITKWGRRDEAYLDIIEGIRLAVSGFFPSITQKSLKIDSELIFHQEKNLSTRSREESGPLLSIDTIRKFEKACDIAESRRQKDKNISKAIVILILLILSLVLFIKKFNKILKHHPVTFFDCYSRCVVC